MLVSLPPCLLELPGGEAAAAVVSGRVQLRSSRWLSTRNGSTLESDLEDVTARVDELESLTTRVDELEQQAADAEARLDELESKLSSVCDGFLASIEPLADIYVSAC